MADMAPVSTYAPKTKKACKSKVKIAAKKPKVRVAPAKVAPKAAPHMNAASILDTDSDGM
ncbi:MAG: hypothetical protein ACKO0Z_09735 [Betaproteobacteria bacterium]